jgi:F1F0 ATPase subunit 2
MNEYAGLTLALVAGVSLGALFFGGLWLTVRRAVSSRTPALWFLGSSVLRTGIVVAGFSFVSGGHWARLLACLMGFLIARTVVARLAGSSAEPQDRRSKEVPHAS